MIKLLLAIQIYKRMNETDNSYRTNVNNIGYWFWFSADRANALENTKTIKKSQKSKKSLQKEEKKVRYY